MDKSLGENLRVHFIASAWEQIFDEHLGGEPKKKLKKTEVLFQAFSRLPEIPSTWVELGFLPMHDARGIHAR